MRVLLRILFIITVPALIAVGTFMFMRQAFLAPMNPERTDKVIVEVAPGKSFSEVSKDLSTKEIVRYPWSLNLLAKFMKADTRIQAGEYEVSASMTPRELLEKLMSGEVVKRIVTVIPGMSIKDIPAVVQQQGLMSADEFAKALTDPGLLARAGISARSFEGYLFPETYQFSRPITPWQIILRMIEEGEKNWPHEFTVRADELRMSRHEILTLASIIEKESGNSDEKPLVSSVFHNRLKRGMKLQADPTVIYGLENFDGDIKDEDLKNPHAYNTYVNLGLPPGPIANPSVDSIRAALFPAESTYLFFVGDGTGKHIFSTTYQEHQEAVNKYQRGHVAVTP